MTIRKRYRKIADFYWRQLSDRKLLEVDFEVVDPDSLDGDVTQLPKNEGRALY